MIPTRIHTVAIVVSLALLAAGTGAVMPTSAHADTGDDPATEVGTASGCAAESPADASDPASDVIGWENGTWYDESIAVDSADGVNASERQAIVDRAMARVEFVRCVEFDRSVPVSVVDRTTLREQQLNQSVAPALRTFDNAKFEALFLVNESTDSIRVQREILQTAVLGFYSPVRKEIVLVAEDEETMQVDEITLAHELVHAWQDQQFNLSTEALSPKVRDEVNARKGLIEGDASYVDQLYQRRCEDGAWNGTCVRPESAGGTAGELANVGIYFLKFQPYADGPTFVRTAHTFGDWDAVDDLYERPPQSSEQVIHPDRYLNDEPSEPSLEDRTAEDWDRVTPPDRPNYGSVGEAAVMSMLVYPYYDSEGQDQVLAPSEWLNFDETGQIDEFDPYDYESNYSAGWDGDRMHVYRNASNETAYVWRIDWDSPQDATEFVRGYRSVLEYWGGERIGENRYRIDEGGFADAFHVSTNGTTVTIVNAPTVEQLEDVRTTIDGQSGATSGNETG